MSKGDGGPVRRFEVFTGAGRRRTWTAEEKAAIVAESYAGADTVCGVARRYGLTPQQLFTWRRTMRTGLLRDGEATTAPSFVPAMVEPVAEPASADPAPARRLQARRSASGAGTIEVEIDGVTVRVGRGADARTVTAVLRALKASP
ncbi:IS66-like element accessory protein TnpA [Prosthecodimorpha staleyi]|uniref:IS66-like element accessory protein TnpA n=1 Tax=Prosthecodimorpha staleyi TaxID=2840188 RepID=UPI0021C370E3|nr:transposase [Prosthecodimorpha staleyi]